MAGNKNDGNPNTGVNQLALKIETADSGKSHVQNQATWPIRALAAQELLRRSEGFGMQANRLQHALDGGTHEVIVIDDEHRGGGCGHLHAARLRWVGYHRFSLSVNDPSRGSCWRTPRRTRC